MYIHEKMKINKFKDVRIPSKGEYFNTGRFMQEPETYGGEDPVNVKGENKVDTLAALEIELEKAGKDSE